MFVVFRFGFGRTGGGTVAWQRGGLRDGVG